MSDEKIVDLARYRALKRGELTGQETAAWAAECEEHALRLYTKNAREMFTGFCVTVFDDIKECPCILIGHHWESRVIAKYNIGKDDRLRRVKPTKRDDKLLQRYRAGVVY